MYEERDIVVETLEYRKARAPHRLIANLEPCIGIGGICKSRGYLLHTQPVGWEGRFPEEIRPILRDLRKLKPNQTFILQVVSEMVRTMKR